MELFSIRIQRTFQLVSTALVRADQSGNKPERVRQHREISGGCLRIAIRAGQGKLHEVPQSPCHHVSVACTVAVHLFGSPDHTGDIHSHTRFFCYDCFYLHFFVKLKPFPATAMDDGERRFDI